MGVSGMGKDPPKVPRSNRNEHGRIAYIGRCIAYGPGSAAVRYTSYCDVLLGVVIQAVTVAVSDALSQSVMSLLWPAPVPPVMASVAPMTTSLANEVAARNTA